MSGLELASDIGTVDVENCVHRMAIRGNWVSTMDVSVDARPTVGSPAELRVGRDDGSFDVFSGAVRRVGTIPGTETLSVTIVGGAGRLLTPEIPALHHAGGAFPVPAGVIAAGIASAAGERLAAGVEAALDAYQVPRWTRVAGSPADAIDVLAGILGLGWRVLADGTIWLGVETWPEVDAEAFFYSGDPRDGALFYATNGAPLRPGTSIDGQRAVEVCYRVNPTGLRVEVRVEQPGDAVRAPPMTPYLASYVGTVKRQGNDGLVDVVCNDERVSNVREIPLKVGIAKCKILVEEDTPVRVCFENGDPRGAYATSIDQVLTADKAVARVDDITTNGTLTIKQQGAEPGPLVIQYQAPSGATSSATITALAGANPVVFTVVTNPTDLSLRGVIASGHPRVLLTDEGQS